MAKPRVPDVGKLGATTCVMTTGSNDLAAGTIVGSYRIIREIGRGGMGSVYEAEHTVLPRRAAIKVMHGELKRHPGMASRMVQEAAILEDIHHPGIVRVYECNLLPDQRVWMAMELVEGETLAAKLQRADTLSPQEVATLLADVADVLAAVHARDIVHRDLKPDNLIFAPTSRAFPLRVIDWGVARLGPVGQLTLDGLTPGTPIYMSPEQATGKNIGAPCDIYSLGVIAYEALAGAPPFDGRTLAEVVCMHLSGEAAPLSERCNAPPALCDLIHAMLAKDPAERPTAVEIRQLTRAIALELSSAYDEYVVELAPEPRRYPAQQHIMQPTPSEETPVVDPEALEFGATQLVPIVRKPRWTPEISYAPGQPLRRPRPDGVVVGEIEARRRH